MYKKKTYLIRENPDDPNSALKIVSGKDFYAITRANNDLPPERRRYFAECEITDGGIVDCIVMETTRENYLAWRREDEAAERRRKAFDARYTLISLDAASDSAAYAVVRETPLEEQDAIESLDLRTLREQAAKWKPWASEAIRLIESGEEKEIPRVLSGLCGVSVQTARKYRKRLMEYLRELVRRYG